MSKFTTRTFLLVFVLGTLNLLEAMWLSDRFAFVQWRCNGYVIWAKTYRTSMLRRLKTTIPRNVKEALMKVLLYNE